MTPQSFSRRLVCGAICVGLCISTLIALLSGPAIRIAQVSTETRQSTAELGSRVGESVTIGVTAVGIVMAALALWETLKFWFAEKLSDEVCHDRIAAVHVILSLKR